MVKKALEEDEDDNEVEKKVVEVQHLEEEKNVEEVEVDEKNKEILDKKEEEVKPIDTEEEELGEKGKEVKKEVNKDEEDKPINPNLWAENKDYDTDDEDGWINPDNFDHLVLGKEELEKVETLKDIGVFIMTTDFAMQNIILQIGIPLLAIDEFSIKRVKTYILECYTCWKLCRDTTKQFCPSCKYATLLKVTCAYNQDGN